MAERKTPAEAWLDGYTAAARDAMAVVFMTLPLGSVRDHLNIRLEAALIGGTYSCPFPEREARTPAKTRSPNATFTSL